MRAFIFVLLVLASLQADATENAILEVDCRYPENYTNGLGIASLNFTSSTRTENVSVVYALSPDAFQKELSTRSTIKFNKVSNEHYVSDGNVLTVRNIEKRPGLVDNACDEGISILVSRFRQKEPEDALRLNSVELYLLDNLNAYGWQFVSKLLRDRSSGTQTRVTETYYFRRK